MFENPVIRGFNPDPSICRVGKDYFLATSTFEYFPGVPIYHSRDLVNWTKVSHALSRLSQFCVNENEPVLNIYAPTLRHHNGVFYMITTNVLKDRKINFFVTTENPYGEWSEPIIVDEGTFDPSLFFDDDGKVYYTRRDFEEDGIVQAEINIKTGKLKTPLRLIAKGFCSWDIEGPHIYRRGDYYYLMSAEGGTWAGHMESLARSKSIWGPFEPCPHNPILTNRHLTGTPIRCIGHADLVDTESGKHYFVFLGKRNYIFANTSQIGRETCLAECEWTDDGWLKVNANAAKPYMVGSIDVKQPYPFEDTIQKKKESVLDDFSSTSLSLDWISRHKSYEKNIILNERENHLRLWGNADNANDMYPVFIGKRQEEFKVEIETLLDFKPQEDSEEASLMVFAAKQFHYEIGIRNDNGKRVLFVRRTVSDMLVYDYEKECDINPIKLIINSDEHFYRFLYENSKGEKVFLSEGSTRLLSTELAGTFTGAVFSLNATGNGKPCKSPADFKYFKETYG